VFGIKPSYGRVPAWPASPFTVLAHQGPLTRSVADAALMLSVISAPDLRDATAWNTPAPDFLAGLDDGVRGLRIAWSPRLGYVEQLDAEAEAAAAKAARMFEELGATVEQVDPGFAEPIDILSAIWFGVSAGIVAAVPEARRDEMDPDFRRMAAKGARVSLVDYLVAHARRAELYRHMLRFHERYDLLLTPQMPIPALEAGRVTPADGRFGDDWINWSPYTYPFNLTGQPAASVPCGFSSDGLPLALQIVGPPRQDALVLRAARAFEAARPFKSLSEPR
jgi:aspartyl-tRNA(Asn)/glutamyl-tRNA(Gln) amidotransferase subunit A